MAFITTGLLPFSSNVNRMFKGERFLRAGELHIFCSALCNDGMTYVALVGDHSTGLADVFSIMTAETTLTGHVTDMIWIIRPVNFHLGKDVFRKRVLNAQNRLFQGIRISL